MLWVRRRENIWKKERAAQPDLNLRRLCLVRTKVTGGKISVKKKKNSNAPVLTVLDCNWTSVDGDSVAVLVWTGTSLGSCQSETHHAPNVIIFLWQRIWLRCYHLWLLFWLCRCFHHRFKFVCAILSFRKEKKCTTWTICLVVCRLPALPFLCLLSI